MTEEEEARHAAGNAATDVAVAPDGGGVSNVQQYKLARLLEANQSYGADRDLTLMVYVGDIESKKSGVPLFPMPPSDALVGTMKPSIINYGLRHESICQLAVGGMAACANTQSGDIITWGLPDKGTLGRAASEERSMEPQPVERAPNKFRLVVSGVSFSLGLTRAGELYFWGRYRTHGDDMGIISDSNGNVRFGEFHATPTRVHGLEGEVVVEVYTSSSSNFWVALTASGKLISCGPAFAGQLCRSIDDPDTNEEFFALSLSSEDIKAMSEDRRSKIFQQALTPKLVTLPFDQTVDNIACGETLTLAILQDPSGRRTVYAAGANDVGQLGNGSVVTVIEAEKNPALRPFQSELRPIESLQEIDVCQIAAGQCHALASDGSNVYAWGKNDCGQTGLVTIDKYIVKPTQVQFGDPSIPRCFIDIVAGERHNMVKTDKGEVYSWGDNGYYQTGHVTDEPIISAPRMMELKVHGVEEPLTVNQMVGGVHETLFRVSMRVEALEALDSAIKAGQKNEAMDIDDDPRVLEEGLDELQIDIGDDMRNHGWIRVSQECGKPPEACKDRYCQLVLRLPAGPQIALQSDEASWTSEEDLKLEHEVLTTFQSIVDSNLERLPKMLTENGKTAFFNLCKPCLTMRKTDQVSIVSSSTERGWQCCRCLQFQTRDNNGLTCELCKQDSAWMCFNCKKSQMDSICENCKQPRPQDSSSQPVPSFASSHPAASTPTSMSAPAASPTSDSSDPVDAPTELDSKASIQDKPSFTFGFQAPARSSSCAGSPSTPSHQEGQLTTFEAPDASAPSSFRAGTPATGSRSFTFGFTSAAAQAPQSVASGSLQLSTPAASGAGSMALASTPQRRRPADPDSVSSRTRSKKRIREDSESAETLMLPSQRGNLTTAMQTTQGSSTSADSTRPPKRLKTPSH